MQTTDPMKIAIGSDERTHLTDAVMAELRRREGLSGLEEFALRKAKAREGGSA